MRPGCTRTGCRAISRPSPRRRPPRCPGSARPGQTPGGAPCCTGSDSLTCPATPAGASPQAAPHGQRHGRRDRRDPPRHRIRAAPPRPGPGRPCRYPARGWRARRAGGCPARLRQHRPLPARTPGGWLDVAGHGRRIRAARVMAAPPGRPGHGCADAGRVGNRTAGPAPTLRPAYGWVVTALIGVVVEHPWPISRPQPDCLYPPNGSARRTRDRWPPSGPGMGGVARSSRD